MDRHSKAPSAELEGWVGAYGRELHAYLWRMLGDRQDAEDGLQETFLRALRARSGPVRSPRPWLYAIATNTARSMIRRRQRLAQRQTDLDDDLHADESSAGAAAERIQAVRRAVASLPPKQREALLLRRYQGLDYRQIGEALKCTPEAARANVYQAVRKLRAKFPEEDR